MNCQSCAFWEVLRPKNDGLCRRYAPRAHAANQKKDTQWPVTYWDEWCGDFKAEEGV